MSIYKTAINKPVTTLLIFVAVIIIGIFGFSKLPIDRFPEMDPPFVTVLTTYPGASAAEIETNVTKLVENSLNSVDHLKEMTSTSKDNYSMVMLEMEWGTDLSEVMNDIRSYVDMLKDNLPSGCMNPYIFKFSSSAMPIMGYAITAKESYAGLEKILNDEVIPQLNRVDGIGNISVSGAPDRYVYVDIDQQKLDAFGIPLETIGTAISSNNLNLSSGVVKMDREQYNLEVRSEYAESREIEDIVVTVTPLGQKVFVKDVATVRDTIKDLSMDEKINGRDGVRMMITKQSGANTVQICRDAQKEMAKIQKGLPSDIDVQMLFDSSEEIQDSINSLEESILYALLFVVLVVFFFLGKWRATLIISVTIPIALIAGFIYLWATGSSLNIISLCSLTVAIGMVVDDAIVVLENITKHIERGSNPREAAIYATNEVWVSVIATTLVIAAVFIPLTMLKGIAGILFKELGWIVTIVVSVSTIVAISLTPMLSSKLLKARKVKVDEKGHLVDCEKNDGWYQKYVVGLLDKIDNAYARLLRFCLSHKAATLIVALAVFIVSLLPAINGKIGTDFMQQTDNGRLSVNIELQNGTRIEQTLKTARALEARIKELVPEMERIATTAGTNDNSGASAIFAGSTTNNTISMTIVCNKKNERERSIFEIAEVIRGELAQYPEIVTSSCAVSGGMGNSSSTVDVEIYGYDFDETNIAATEIRNAIKNNVKGARDVIISRAKDRPELKITVDKEKASALGLSSATVSTYVRNRVSGQTVGYLKEDGDEYDIVVRLKEEDRNSLSDIIDMSIPTPTGKIVKLGEVATVEDYFAPPTIERKNRQRYVKVSVTPYKVSLGELAAQIEGAMTQVSLPNTVNTVLAGDYEDQQKTFGDMIGLILLVIMLVYVVMASQFESFSKPFIIMMSLPFALTGVILALWITNTSLDLIGALGVIMLVGIVVKNGIVLVDYINLMRDRGYDLKEAIALSGRSRLRPVLMTALTTVLGMVPMALSNGEGSEMWRPMGIVVIGGLLVSTFITLIVVPVFYAVLCRNSERAEQEKKRKEYIFMQLSTDEEE
ncbi:MAG: efflux RND transporter permease subunit [Bacteroidales bacterium]|nr:efflux RND transporter permease subunit [Candidatus Equibacterium intestinale]